MSQPANQKRQKVPRAPTAQACRLLAAATCLLASVALFPVVAHAGQAAYIGKTGPTSPINTGRAPRGPVGKLTLLPALPADKASEIQYEKIFFSGSNNIETTGDAVSALRRGDITIIVYDPATASYAFMERNQNVFLAISDSAIRRAIADSKTPVIILDQGRSAAGKKLSLSALANVIFIFVNLLVMFRLFGLTGGGNIATRIRPNDPGAIKFADVAGLKQAKDELGEIVDFLKYPERYERMNARIPSGVLLEGPPGNGKTMLARAVAGEAAVPFYAINASEVIGKFVGVGSGRIKRAFAGAQRRRLVSRIRSLMGGAERGGGILFIDEIDVIAQKRDGGGDDSASQEYRHILTQLLLDLDGIKRPRDPKHPIILIGATNRSHTMDPALLRPGRIDRRIKVHAPDSPERVAILRIYAEKHDLADDVDFVELASMTPGMSGADLRNMVNEAVMIAIRHGSDVVGQRYFEDAIMRIVAGVPRPNLKMTADQRRVVAIHEAGHALIAYLIPDADKPIRATIVPHGDAAGLVTMEPPPDEIVISRKRIIAKVKVMLAGRAAEVEVFGFEQATSGALADRQQAISLLRTMVGDLGLGKTARHIGNAPLSGGWSSSPDMSEKSKEVFDGAVAEEFDAAEREVALMLRENVAALQALGGALLAMKTLGRKDIENIICEFQGADERAPDLDARRLLGIALT